MEKDPIQNNELANPADTTRTQWDTLVLNSEGPNKKYEHLNATRKEDYLESENGQRELFVEDVFDKTIEDIENMVKNGEITQEEARKREEIMLNFVINSIDAIRKEEYGRQKQEGVQKMVNILSQIATDDDKVQRMSEMVNEATSAAQPTSEPAPAGPTAEPEPTVSESAPEPAPEPTSEPEPQQAYEVYGMDIENEIKELQDAMAKDSEEIKQLSTIMEEYEKEVAELNARRARKQLVGIDADFNYDRESLIRDKAVDAYAAEKSEAGFFKRVKMNFFEKYYKQKYAREIDAGQRKITVDGKEMTLDEALQDRSDGAIGRFVNSIVENDINYLNTADGMRGENRKVDPVTTEAVRTAILEYAQKRGDGADEKLFKEQLRRKLRAIQPEESDANHFNNYFDIAERAIEIKDMARGTMSLEQVLEDFKVYNAKVRESYSSETHRESVQNILSALRRNGYRMVIGSNNIIIAAESAELLAKSGLLATPNTTTTTAPNETAPAPEEAPAPNVSPVSPESTAAPKPEAQPSTPNDYDSYRGILGEKGIELINSTMPIDTEYSADFGGWWSGLDAEGKRTAIDIANNLQVSADGRGRAFKALVSLNAGDNATPAASA